MTPLLAAMLLLQAVNADTATLGHDATSWCHEYHYLKAVIEATRSEFTSRIQALKQDQEQKMVWNLAAADEQAKGSGKAMQILSMATENIANLQLQALNTFSNDIKLPLMYLQTRLNIYQSVQAAPTLLQFKTGNGAHGNGAATSTECTVPITFAADKGHLCQPAAEGLTVAAVKAKLATITKAKAAGSTAINDLVQAEGIQMHAQAGTWTSTGTVTGGCACTVSRGTDFKIHSPGTATAKPTTLPAAKDLPATAAVLPKNEADATDPTKHNEKHLLAVYKKLQTAFANKPLKLTDITLAQIRELARKSNIDAALLDPLGRFGKAGSEPSNSKLDAEMDRIYNSGTDFKTNFIYNAKTIKIKITDEAGSEPMELQQIVAKGEISKALAYLEKQQLQKQLAEKSAATTAAATSASQTCQTKNKKADCKDGDGCKWTNEMEETGSHCKAKNDGEGVKTENEGTANTNTTGINSFVINKAPLLLAFLLLLLSL
uniref:Variant surface glycoprotein 555 n=1 Tax=Trypanosoma brucei TaxID=5691 RepID=M4SXB8_9TRYP|nr:variant surface glycoprotein 555 [Trypanosoma brucei]